MQNNHIEELYGVGVSNNMQHFGNVNTFQGSGVSRNFDQQRLPSNLNQCGHQLSNWQRQVYDCLVNRLDLIVNPPPAAGKTLPVLCFFKTVLLNFLKAKSDNINANIPVPRIIVCAPTKFLAQQLSNQDFLRDSNLGLLRMVAENPEIFRKLFYTGAGRPIELTRGEIQNIDPSTGLPFQMRGTNITSQGKDLPGNLHPSLINDLIPLTQKQITEIYDIISSEFIATLYGGVGLNESFSKLPNIFGKIKPIICGTYEPISRMLEQYGQEFNWVLLDESQEYFRPGTATVSSELDKKQDAFMRMIQYTSKNASLVLMTGSTNINTIRDIQNVINTYFNRKLEVFPGKLPDEIGDKRERESEEKATKNRSTLYVSPYGNMQTPQDLKDLIVRIINEKQTNSLITLFSLRRATAGGILRLIEDLVNDKRLPIINREFINNNLTSDQERKFIETAKSILNEINIKLTQEKNPELIKQLTGIRDSLSKDISINLGSGKDRLEFIYKLISELEKILEKTTSETDYNKTIIKIDNLRSLIGSELNSIQRFDSNGNVRIGIKNVSDYEEYEKTKNQDMTLKQLADRESKNYINSNPNLNLPNQASDIEFLKYFDVRSLEQRGEDVALLPYPDPNNLLYQGVLRGFGIMAGKLQFKQKEVIQKLFRDQKIYLCLVTDAVGIGSNLSVKTLYIPSFKKINENGQFSQNDESSIVQIINRVGRGVFNTGQIYCSPDDYSEVKRLVTEDPRVAVSEIEPAMMGNIVKLAQEKGIKAAMPILFNKFIGN